MTLKDEIERRIKSTKPFELLLQVHGNKTLFYFLKRYDINNNNNNKKKLIDFRLQLVR